MGSIPKQNYADRVEGAKLQEVKEDLLFLLTPEILVRISKADHAIIEQVSKTFVKAHTVTPTQAEFIQHIKAKFDGKIDSWDVGEIIDERDNPDTKLE